MCMTLLLLWLSFVVTLHVLHIPLYEYIYIYIYSKIRKNTKRWPPWLQYGDPVASVTAVFLHSLWNPLGANSHTHTAPTICWAFGVLENSREWTSVLKGCVSRNCRHGGGLLPLFTASTYDRWGLRSFATRSFVHAYRTYKPSLGRPYFIQPFGHSYPDVVDVEYY